MANSTLLVLMQNAMQSLGVATSGQPSAVISNTNQDVVQTLALVNIEGDTISREHDWHGLKVQYNFPANTYSYTGTTTADSASVTSMSSITGLDVTFMLTGTGIPQDTFVTEATGTTVTMNRNATAAGSGTTLTFSQVLFSYPTGFDRPINRTHWDKSKRWEMLGPATDQQAAWLRSGYISTGPRIRYWPMGQYLQIWPPLGSEESLSYEYLSKYWVAVTGTDAGSKQYFTVDTDTCIFPDALMHAMIRYKYYQAKGFDTTTMEAEYRRQKDLAKAHDAGSPVLSFAPQPSDILIGFNNIPDSGYGS